MWQQTTRQEHNRRIYEQELAPFLPDTLVDVHIHLCPPEALPSGQKYNCAGHDIAGYTVEDLVQDLADALPRQRVLAVCFGLPKPSYDMALNNRYVAGVCDRKRLFAFRLFDPHESDAAQVRADIVNGGFVGLKPYPDYASDPAATDVDHMLPPWIMQIADELGLIIMLHLPRPGRLADPLNQQQVPDLCRRYPRAKVVLAHIGRAYFLKNIVGQLDALKELPNLYYDLAMVSNADVLEYAFRTLRPDRLLFGTDIPIALAPGASVEINDQYTYVTPVPWKLSISDDHGKLVFTSFLYESLRAIRKAIQRIGLGPDFVQGLFSGNALRLLGSART